MNCSLFVGFLSYTLYVAQATFASLPPCPGGFVGLNDTTCQRSTDVQAATCGHGNVINGECKYVRHQTIKCENSVMKDKKCYSMTTAQPVRRCPSGLIHLNNSCVSDSRKFAEAVCPEGYTERNGACWSVENPIPGCLPGEIPIGTNKCLTLYTVAPQKICEPDYYLVGGNCKKPSSSAFCPLGTEDLGNGRCVGLHSVETSCDDDFDEFKTVGGSIKCVKATRRDPTYQCEGAAVKSADNESCTEVLSVPCGHKFCEKIVTTPVTVTCADGYHAYRNSTQQHDCRKFQEGRVTTECRRGDTMEHGRCKRIEPKQCIGECTEEGAAYSVICPVDYSFVSGFVRQDVINKVALGASIGSAGPVTPLSMCVYVRTRESPGNCFDKGILEDGKCARKVQKSCSTVGCGLTFYRYSYYDCLPGFTLIPPPKGSNDGPSCEVEVPERKIFRCPGGKLEGGKCVITSKPVCKEGLTEKDGRCFLVETRPRRSQ